MTEELNKRHNLATMPTINNNGESYIVPFDIYKEGYDAYDISNWFKGRVGDNGTPFGIRWYKHGQLMDVTGMRPFIEGQVGDYTIDDSDPDNPKINMDSEASNVHVVGEVNDCQEYGVAIYRLINQAMPQSGIFYGKIGVMGTQDDGTTVMSSVDVVFKVLAGHMSMVGARKFYVSELEKALLDFKAKIKQHEQEYADLVEQHNQEFQNQTKKFNDDTQKVIDDARNAYESETKDAHDSLDALKSQIQANRDEQQNLSNRLVGTEQQIEIHDVVTRPEFLNLSNQLTQQVSQMKEAGLEFFNNADALKAKYPNGANKLCVTLNDSHEWVYDYANGQWNDAGAFNYGTIDPKLTTAIYQNNPDNLIPNSDFLTTDLWTLSRDQTAPDCFIEPTSRGNALVINGYLQDGSTNESWAATPSIEVTDSKYISVGAEIALSGIDYNNGKFAMISFAFRNKDGSDSYINRNIRGFFQDGQFHKITEMNVAIPADAVSFYIAFALYGNGTLKIRRPQASFSNALNPYSSSDLETKLALTDDNLLIGQPAKDWDFTFFYQNCTVDSENVINLDCSNALDTDNNIIASDYIAVDSNDQLIANVEAQINSTNSRAYFEIGQYTDIDTQTPNSNIDEYFINTNELTDYVFDNIELQPSTKFIQIRIVTYGKAILKIRKIALKKKTALDLARDKVLRSKNLAYDFSYKNWRVLSASNCIMASENDGIVQITSTDPVYGILSSSKIAVDATKPLNISFNAKSDCSYGNWRSVEITPVDENNEAIANENIELYIANTSELQKYNFNNIQLNPTTKYIQIRIVISQPGSVWINNLKCDNVKTDEDSNNLFDDIPLNEWRTNSQYCNFDEKNSIWNISTRNLQNTWTSASSNLIAVEPGSTIKTELEAKVGILPNNQGQSYIEFQQFPECWSPINYSTDIDNVFTEDTENEFKTFKFVNKLNADTHYIRIVMNVTNNGDFQLSSIKGSYVDEIPNNLPKFKIYGTSNITDKWQSAPFKFNDDGRLLEGYVQYAMQGDSSKSYPKKNLKVKLFSDADCKNELKFKPKATWQANNKFNIKANYIDATQARNLVNAANFANAGRATALEHQSHTPLLKAQALGQMEGLPLELSFIDGYYGLMTLNTKKDEKSFGMDSKVDTNEAIEIEQSKDPFSDATVTIDGTEFATDVHDQANDATKTNFSKMLSFISTSNDADFKAKLGNYFDVKSIMNAMLWGLMSNMWDSYDKSIILLSWDNGLTWYFTLYDMDSTWDLYWNGSKLQGACDITTGTIPSIWQNNTLYKRVYTNFKDELQAQYNFLRKNVWRNDQLCRSYKQFIDSIPETAYERDQTKWPDIPSVKITDFGQIQSAIIRRGAAMDNFMAHLTDSTAK